MVNPDVDGYLNPKSQENAPKYLQKTTYQKPEYTKII